LWERFIETFLLEGVDFLRGEDRILIFVAEEEDSLEGGDDGWLEILFLKVEEWGLSSDTSKDREQKEAGYGWEEGGGSYDGMGDSALTEVKNLVDVNLGLCTASNTTFDLFKFLHDRNHFLRQRTFHLPFRNQITLIRYEDNGQINTHRSEKGKPEKGYAGGSVGIGIDETDNIRPPYFMD